MEVDCVGVVGRVKNGIKAHAGQKNTVTQEWRGAHELFKRSKGREVSLDDTVDADLFINETTTQIRKFWIICKNQDLITILPQIIQQPTAQTSDSNIDFKTALLQFKETASKSTTLIVHLGDTSKGTEGD